MKDKKLHNIKKPGFKTPDFYFESIEDAIFDKLKDENVLSDNKDAGYEAPEAYFDSIEDRVMRKLNEEASLDKIAGSGFNAPDDYFETIEEKVFDTLNKDKDTKAISLFSRRNLLYVSGLAAAIMIMFGIFSNKTDGGIIDDIDLEVVETYLEEQNLDTYDIASLLTEEDLAQEDFGIINDNFSEESLEDYLIDNANLEDIIEL